MGTGKPIKCGNQSKIEVEMRAGRESPDMSVRLKVRGGSDVPQHRTVAVGCRTKETSGSNKEECGVS